MNGTAARPTAYWLRRVALLNALVFGWTFVIGGAARLLFPDAVRSIQGAAIEKPLMPTIGGTVQAVLGAWLCYVGFLA